MEYFTYIDWTREEIPRPFYVGKGNYFRVNDVVRNRKHTWVAKNFGQYREIVFGTNDEKDAYEFEALVVMLLDTYNPNPKDYGDIRCNMTPGGIGCTVGHVHSEESKQKMRVRAKQQHSDPRKHKMTVSRLREAMKRPEVHRNVIEGHRRSQEKRSQTIGSEIVRKKISESTKIAMSSPELRAEISKKVKLALSKPETHEKMLAMYSRKRKSVIQLTKETKIVIAEFKSIAEAVKMTGVNGNCISSCCRGKIKSAGGFYWKFSEKKDDVNVIK